MIEKDTLSLHFVERNDVMEDDVICSVHIPLSQILFTESECKRHERRKRQRREKKVFDSWERKGTAEEEEEEEEDREHEREREKEREKVSEEHESVAKTEKEREEEERERNEKERRERGREESKERCWETKRKSEEIIHERSAYLWVQLAANCRLQLKVYLLPLSPSLSLSALSHPHIWSFFLFHPHHSPHSLSQGGDEASFR